MNALSSFVFLLLLPSYRNQYHRSWKNLFRFNLTILKFQNNERKKLSKQFKKIPNLRTYTKGGKILHSGGYSTSGRSVKVFWTFLLHSLSKHFASIFPTISQALSHYVCYTFLVLSQYFPGTLCFHVNWFMIHIYIPN